jgi:hypothetical protein
MGPIWLKSYFCSYENHIFGVMVVGWKHLATIPWRIYKANEFYMNKKFVHAMNEHLNVVAKKDIGPIKFTMLLLKRGRRNPIQFSIYFHMMFKGRPMTNELVVNKLRKNLVYLAWVHNPSCVMKLQHVINNLGFPFIHVWLKISNGLLCCFPCNKWLMGLLQIIWSEF